MRITNDALLNAANYENFHSVKEMLALYNSHERNAYRGDTVSHSIWIDLKEAIYSGALTEKQLEAVELYYIHNETQESIGVRLGISRDSVKNRLNGAVSNIQKLLISGMLFMGDTPKVGDNLYCNIEGDFCKVVTH